MRIIILSTFLFINSAFSQYGDPKPEWKDTTKKTVVNNSPVTNQGTISHLERSANFKIGSMITGVLSGIVAAGIISKPELKQPLLIPMVLFGTTSVVCSLLSTSELKQAGKVETERMKSGTTGKP